MERERKKKLFKRNEGRIEMDKAKKSIRRHLSTGVGPISTKRRKEERNTTL
jgi:hypothetical protein